MILIFQSLQAVIKVAIHVQLTLLCIVPQYADIESDQDVIIEDSSDGEEHLDTSSTNSSSSVKIIISIVIAFLLKLRVIYNVFDRAVVLLLCFFKFILMMVGNLACQNLRRQSIFHRACTVVILISTFLQLHTQNTLCPSCHLLYSPDLQSLILGTPQWQVSQKWSFVEFPNHPQERFRIPCNTNLLNQVQETNQITFKPRKVHYYYGIRAALPILLKRPAFLKG